MKFVGRLSDSHCYSYALSDQTGEDHRPGSQFLFDNFKPFLNTSLTKFSRVSNNFSIIDGILLNPSNGERLEG